MFANPVFLYALAAGAIPVLVHLIFRRRRTAVEFPTLMFFHRVDMKLASRRKLKEVLLLILRALALMFVALALARPGWQSNTSDEGTSADAVLIIDNSATMGLSAPAGTRLEQARSRAKSILTSMGRTGRVALITTVAGDPAGEIATLS